MDSLEYHMDGGPLAGFEHHLFSFEVDDEDGDSWWFAVHAHDLVRDLVRDRISVALAPIEDESDIWGLFLRHGARWNADEATREAFAGVPGLAYGVQQFLNKFCADARSDAKTDQGPPPGFQSYTLMFSVEVDGEFERYSVDVETSTGSHLDIVSHEGDNVWPNECWPCFRWNGARWLFDGRDYDAAMERITEGQVAAVQWFLDKHCKPADADA